MNYSSKILLQFFKRYFTGWYLWLFAHIGWNVFKRHLGKMLLKDISENLTNIFPNDISVLLLGELTNVWCKIWFSSFVFCSFVFVFSSNLIFAKFLHIFILKNHFSSYRTFYSQTNISIRDIFERNMKYVFPLRILTEKTHPKIKLKCLRKAWILTFR